MIKRKPRILLSLKSNLCINLNCEYEQVSETCTFQQCIHLIVLVYKGKNTGSRQQGSKYIQH